MLSFLQYREANLLLAEAEANTHSTHIEDLCIIDRKRGIAKALGGILHIKKQFGVSSSKQTPSVTIKIDGAPAIIAGWIGGKFFVGSKSLFNKEPKINYTPEDVDRNHSGGLAEKLKLALYYLQDVIPQGKIYQGDFLFDSNSRESKSINGVDSWIWQPNTIQYSVDKNSELGKKIGAAKFGIIFHTEYMSNGIDVSSIHLKGFGVKEEDLKKSKDVWFIDAYHHDLGGISSLSVEENRRLAELEKIVTTNQSNVDWNYDIETQKQLMIFLNTYIRNNKAQPSPAVKAVEYKNYVITKRQDSIDSKKSERGKATEAKKWESVIEYAQKTKSLEALFKIHNALTDMKMMMIAKLDSLKAIKTFLVKTNGDIQVTGNEGFVLTKTSASGAKFVDRYSFSLANFSPLFKKGWEH